MLVVQHLNLSLGGLKILSDLTLTFEEGKITGLIGPNGAGKSTVFNVITGLIPFAKGSVKLRGQELLGDPPYQINRLGIMRTFQDAQVLPQISVLENLISVSPLIQDTSLTDVFFRPKITTQRKEEAKQKALTLLKRVGIENKAKIRAENLSYGQTKLTELLKIMMSEAELIFLDEPFSGLYPEMVKIITKLIYELTESGKTVVIVEHNMKLIEEVCDNVIVLDFGENIAEGTFKQIRRKKEVVEAYLGN
jgi:ABC-type branched-subunit amino acid transport system ATPase component